MGIRNGAIIKCDYCGKEFYLKKSRLERDTHYKYCSNECQHKGKIVSAIDKYKRQNNIQDMGLWLYQKYILEKLSIKQIMYLLHSETNRSIAKMLKYYNISVRTVSEGVKLQWQGEKSIERKKQTSELASKNLNSKESRDKLRSIMQTADYKNKISKANSGKNNGMYGIIGENNALWNPNKTRLQRQRDRKLTENTRWRNDVFKRDNYTCKITNKAGHGCTSAFASTATWSCPPPST